METNFLGCIGYLMAGSGLKELLEVIYASNAVDNMLTGKAISRAVRGHMLVDAALNAMLIAMTYDSLLPGTDALDKPHDCKMIEEVCSADVLCRSTHMIERQKEALEQSRTVVCGCSIWT